MLACSVLALLGVLGNLALFTVLALPPAYAGAAVLLALGVSLGIIHYERRRAKAPLTLGWNGEVWLCGADALSLETCQAEIMFDCDTWLLLRVRFTETGRVLWLMLQSAALKNIWSDLRAALLAASIATKS